MKKVFIQAVLILFVSGAAYSKDIRNSQSISIHYPGIGLRHNGPGILSTELRLAHKGGITLVGYRWYRLMGKSGKINFYLVPEGDFLYFARDDNAGIGSGIGIFGCMEYFFSDNLSFGAEIGPAVALAYTSGVGATGVGYGIAVNFSFNWIYKQE